MDTRPGSADDLWLCSWAIALAAAAPSGGLFLPPGPCPYSPTFSAVGRDDARTFPHGQHGIDHAHSTYFTRFLRAHYPLENPHAHAAPPPCGRSFVAPGLWPGHALCPLPSHVTPRLPHHNPVLPPGVLPPGTPHPPPLFLGFPAHVRGDLPFGAAHCEPED